MKISKNWFVPALFMAAILAAWGAWSGRPYEKTDIAKKMTQKMTTVCVGRFLIDLPEDAEVQFAAARVAGITIDVRAGYTEDRLKAELAQRERVLNQEKNGYGQPSYEKKDEVNAINFKATALYYAREKPRVAISDGQKVLGSEERVSVEAFGLHDSRLYHFQAEHQATPRSVDKLAGLIKKFEARSAENIPDQPGFCTEGALVHDPIRADDVETVTMFASLKGHPDLAIRLATFVNFNRIDESLLERDQKNDVKLEHPNAVTTLRRQHRALNGIDGDEVLDKYKEENGTSAHIFMWAGMGKMRDVTAPEITLELETGIGRPGEPINSSLSDDATLKLWDAISSSLRVRPVSTRLGAGLGVERSIPLGEQIATGQACSQTGYWECDAPGTIDGAGRRFFKQGETMPAAILRRAPSLWNKLSGKIPVDYVSTVWKLVDYEAQTRGNN